MPQSLTKPEEIAVLEVYKKYLFRNCNKKTPTIVIGIPRAIKIFREFYKEEAVDYLIKSIKFFASSTMKDWMKEQHPSTLAPKNIFSCRFVEDWLVVIADGYDCTIKDRESDIIDLSKFNYKKLAEIANTSAEDLKEYFGKTPSKITQEELSGMIDSKIIHTNLNEALNVYINNGICNISFYLTMKSQNLDTQQIPSFLSKDLINAFSLNSDDGEWLYLFGNHNTQKTFTAIILGLNAIKNGRSVYFLDLSDSLSSTTMSLCHRLKEHLRFIKECDLLIIDNVKTDSLCSEWERKKFRMIIEGRYNDCKQTVFTSTYLADKFEDVLGIGKIKRNSLKLFCF